MKTETFYRKVEIRTADDLPTERGFYFVHYKKHLMDVKHWPTIHPVEWAEDMDWYLQPFELELPGDDMGKVINKWELILQQDRGKNIYYSKEVIEEILSDIKSIKWLRDKIKEQLMIK